ncbi:MAG: NUDIX hydrolase [Candidatus Aenigmatarchaeota archaeon]
MRFETSKGFINIFASGAVIKDKKVLLIHRREPDVWEFPSGNIEYGEHPSETAKREVKEETDLDVVVEKLLAIGSTIRSDKEHEIVLSFLCRPKSSFVKL